MRVYIPNSDPETKVRSQIAIEEIRRQKDPYIE